MKKIMILLMGLICAFSFSACDSSETSAKNFESIAREMTELMYDGDYEGAAAYISDSAPAGLDASALEEIVEGTREAYGDYVGISGMERSSMSEFVENMNLADSVDSGEFDYVVYFQGVAFEMSEMGFYIMFDPDDRGVVNITVVGLEARSDLITDEETEE